MNRIIEMLVDTWNTPLVTKFMLLFTIVVGLSLASVLPYMGWLWGILLGVSWTWSIVLVKFHEHMILFVELSERYDAVRLENEALKTKLGEL